MFLLYCDNCASSLFEDWILFIVKPFDNEFLKVDQKRACDIFKWGKNYILKESFDLVEGKS